MDIMEKASIQIQAFSCKWKGGWADVGPPGRPHRNVHKPKQCAQFDTLHSSTITFQARICVSAVYYPLERTHGSGNQTQESQFCLSLIPQKQQINSSRLSRCREKHTDAVKQNLTHGCVGYTGFPERITTCNLHLFATSSRRKVNTSSLDCCV